jgi:UDP-N-acetylmuramoyl-tripeptide--D-alanyl-D-alanine ligase
MTPILVQDFAQRCGGTIHGSWSSPSFTGFALDNREAKPGDLFLAIKGANVDGHQFVSQALASGAIGALVEKPTDGPYILVSNLVEALGRYGRSRREEFFGPVIGITGSAGKTSTKEFVAAALSPLGPILKNAGNRNTEYTSPLVWAQLEPKHRGAVIEMSMRGFDQVAHLAAVSKPVIGIVTNIGHAHAEMVGSREGIARAKAELLEALPPNGNAIVWAEDEFLEVLKSRSRAPISTFGFTPSDCQILRYRPLSWTECEVEGTLGGTPWQATLKSVGRHMALNAAAAILAAHCTGVPVQEAADALKSAVLPPMRMEVRDFNGATIVLDNYNASPPSMIAAIETLAEIPTQGRRLAVIGEMRELGQQSEEGHRSVGETLARTKIDEILFVGAEMEAAMKVSHLQNAYMATELSDVTEFLRSMKPGDVVLVKGSRALELEKALDPLMETVG